MTIFKLRFMLSAAAVGLAIGVAVALWQRSAAGSSAPASQAEMSVTASAATQAPPQAPAAPAPRGRGAALAVPADAAPAAAETASMPDEDASAQVVPVVFHIRNRRDLNKIDGDIRNVTSRPLSITLRAVNAGSQASSEIQFQLAPGERRLYSNDELYMQADDQLIVQSPPYQDRVVRVP